MQVTKLFFFVNLFYEYFKLNKENYPKFQNRFG